MISIGWIIEWAGLVDDAVTRLLGLDHDAIDLVESIDNLRVQGDCRLDCSLGMKFGRKGYLEENIFHRIGSIALGEFERFFAKGDVLESPGWSGNR